MPHIRVAQHGRRPTPIEATSAAPGQPFAFPNTHHLVITTQERVLSWGGDGLTSAFASGSGGILAAKEARDGSGLLAVADSQVVVLHDVNHGMERSYRLKGTDGQIRLLEYADDSKSLFFTTTLQNAVQSYSLRQSCLLDPAHTHPSPPTVLAVSKTSHLLLSASESPPTIYLQNLTLRTAPVLLQPRASTAPAVVAAFHPERPNVFLVAFRDGTLAAYDATRFLGDRNKTALSRGHGGEIGRFKDLHHVTNKGAVDPSGNLSSAALGGYDEGTKTVGVGSRAVGITGAAFLPGHRSRAVSVGGDGRCRIVDFELGGKVLRTWHVKGPATCLSVLSLAVQGKSREGAMPGRMARSTRPTPGSATGGTAAMNNIIAVGREDGKVLMFDSVGLQLCEEMVDPTAGRVIDIEWLQGPGLKTSSKTGLEQTRPDTIISLPQADGQAGNRRASKKSRRSVEFALDDSSQNPNFDDGTVLRQPPPAEEEDDMTGTVNHNPSTNPINRVFPAIPSSAGYMDLFSPVKQPVPMSPKRRSPPKPRNRPRILSTTFVGNDQGSQPTSPTRSPIKSLFIDQQPPNYPVNADDPDVKRTNGVLSLKDSTTRRPVDAPIPPVHSPRLAKPPAARTPRIRKARRVSNARMPMPGTYSSSSTTTTTSSSSKILADIRRLGAASGGKGRDGSGGIALLAPYMNPRGTGTPTGTPTGTLKGVVSDAKMAEEALGGDEDEGRREQQKEKHKSHAAVEDIWMTSPSASEAEAVDAYKSTHLSHHSRRRGATQPHRRPYSPPESPEHHLTTPSPEHRPHHLQPQPLPLSPGSAQSPVGPVDVQDFFPRRSSLRHGKAGKRSRRRGEREGEREREVLGEVEGNATAAELLSPRPVGGRKSALLHNDGRAADASAGHAVWEDADGDADGEGRGDGCECGNACCRRLRAESERLRAEVEALRREVDAMRVFIGMV
ncbi:WD40 repeat-like protein [Saccharata proteae CBS 121410]|uniref:WD40 repeat-like protein n=1 Tax=Saccharata proteae CBS 121410 TaxID=1314787 RepID=A0A9P4HRT9_9PEZI|nr:WD40 repeat-like protein [Saccharata proteae CBS 121410]